jgi:hypothetical protein
MVGPEAPMWWWLACRQDEVERSAEVRSVEVEDGPTEVDRVLVVELGEAAPVAARCTSGDDPQERHLVESAGAGTRHELRFQGLAADTVYECEVSALPSGRAAVVELTTGAPRVEFPRLEVERDAALEMTGDYTLTQWIDGACNWETGGWLVIFDADGAPRWWYRLNPGVWVDVESLYDPADGTILWGGGDDHEYGAPTVVDLWDGDVERVRFPGWENTRFTHDAKRLPDGTVLMLDNRNITDGETQWKGFGVGRYDLDADERIYDLGSQRYFDEGVLGPPRGDHDPYHVNWVDWVAGPDDDRIYLSLCSDWSILSLDADSGDVRWKLARGEGWTVVDAAGQDLGEGALPQCQHGNELVGDDHLLVYDNGQSRDHSQVVEWRIDAAAHRAVRTWSWTEPGWHEGTLGDVDDLGGGRVLVTQAHPECWTDTPGDRSAIVEVDRASGRVAHRLTFPRTQDTNYRAQRIDGCDLFSDVRTCPARAERERELARQLGW